jgi:thioesterase domain-containing protein/acyl carrier protein
MRPVPLGARGELYIGGPGLARGYVNRPEVSAEKFLPHCFSATPGARLYRTGDLARYRPDGQIEYLGRADRQIKLHGYRIEPGEIEVVLGSHEAVREAVVVVREVQETDKRLLAYVVVDEAAIEQTPAGLRGYLAEKLPSYMVPSTIVMCDEIPLTPNGKVDVEALAKPEEILRSGSIAPRDAVELQLARIWGEILSLDSVGVNDNFFDLGGNSMSAVRLMARVQKEFGQGLPLSILFQQGTVEHLAAILRQPSVSEAWSHVVEIQRGDLKPPLFFVHAAGGNVFSYVRLANRLGPDQPFYGVQASGLIAGQRVYDSIEEMAARYIDAIRLVQPRGPYFIGGWSFGGIVAFEMARQLGMQGQTAKLVLVDTSAAIGRTMPVDDDPALALGFARDLGINLDDQAASYDELQQLTSAEQLRWVLTQAIVTHVLPPDYEFLQIQQYFAVYKANLVAWAKYRPEVYSGPITLFRASDRPLENYLDPTMGWNELASGEVDLHTIPGGHYSLLTPPNVGLLAEELKRSLTQSLTAEAEG